MNIDPDRSSNLSREWHDHMRAGHFERAWQVADEVRRLQTDQDPFFLPWQLQGGSERYALAGKRVLIYCCHGLGDTLQFIRYAPWVRQLAGRVGVCSQPELLPLLQTMSDGFDELVQLPEDCPPRDYDLSVEVMELPYVFRTTAESIPANVPYFHVRKATLPTESRPNIGLVWQAGDWDEHRSIDFDLLRPLILSSVASWHILQRGRARLQWNHSFGFDSGSDDILAAARVIAALDLVISVDSMPAHLAGALGVPIWILLRKNADWRWQKDREDSPWYPTMRIFRQKEPGDWEEVLARVREALCEVCGTAPGYAQC
jgi:hypothetical protein